MKKISRVRPGRDVFLATVKLSSVFGGYSVVGRASDDDLAGHRDHGAFRDLQLDAVVLDHADGAEDTCGQDDLVADLDLGLQLRDTLLRGARGPRQDEPESHE